MKNIATFLLAAFALVSCHTHRDYYYNDHHPQPAPHHHPAPVNKPKADHKKHAPDNHHPIRKSRPKRL